MHPAPALAATRRTATALGGAERNPGSRHPMTPRPNGANDDHTQALRVPFQGTEDVVWRGPRGSTPGFHRLPLRGTGTVRAGFHTEIPEIWELVPGNWELLDHSLLTSIATIVTAFAGLVIGVGWGSVQAIHHRCRCHVPALFRMCSDSGGGRGWQRWPSREPRRGWGKLRRRPR
jgi:hypothetical protein